MKDEGSRGLYRRSSSFILPPSSFPLHRLGPPYPIVDSNRLLGGDDEDLAVADIPVRSGAGHVHDAVDRAVEEVVVDEDLQRDLAQQMRLVLVAAIHLRAAPLAAVALGIADGHPRYADLVERFAQRLELGRLNDGQDQLHALRSNRNPMARFRYGRCRFNLASSTLRIRAAVSSRWARV